MSSVGSLLPRPTSFEAASATWRDELVEWTRSLATTLPPIPSIETIASRFDLPPDYLAPLALLYGMHLRGEPGVAPVELAKVSGGRWDDALGRGLLAELGITTFLRSRIELAEAIVRTLDERSPRYGFLVGEPGGSSLLGPCGIVTGGEPIESIAVRLASQLGTGFLVGAHAAQDLSRDALAEAMVGLYVEARARGVTPMLRVETAPSLRPEPAVFVTDMPDILDRLGLPHL